MYFPYLRGKQFELIAIRELCALFPDDIRKISPVLEPVKNSSTLRSTLQELMDKRVNFTIIINPRVGDLQYRYGELIDLIKETVTEYSNFQLGVIIDGKTKEHLSEMVNAFSNIDFEFNGVTFIHNIELADDSLRYLRENFRIIYNLVNFDKTSRRYYRVFERSTLVSLDDYFKEQTRNADYLDMETFFSEEHLFYEDDGFIGFGDFLTVGDNYSESGFLPRAVAIHISYFDQSKIKVKHFVSDSNGDVSDIGGKFAEAAEKVFLWSEETGNETEAIKTLKNLHLDGHFPGLGSLKKLSIMNHIELMFRVL